MILFLILLIVLAVTGALWFVLKVAVGVALGLFLAAVLIGAYVAWRVRRTLFGPPSRRRRRAGRSRVEIVDPRYRWGDET